MCVIARSPRRSNLVPACPVLPHEIASSRTPRNDIRCLKHVKLLNFHS